MKIWAVYSYLICSMPALSIINIYIYMYIIVRASFRKCTSFLNSEYNFQFYWRVIGERSEPPLSVELSEFSLYLYIYIYIYIYIFIYIYLFIYFRPYVVHVPLTRYAQTSDLPVEVQRSI